MYQFSTKNECKMPPFWDPFWEVFAQKNGHFCVFMFLWVSELQKSAMGGPKRTRDWEFWGPKTPNFAPFPIQLGHFLEFFGAKGPTLEFWGGKSPMLGPQCTVRGRIWGILMAIVFFCILHMAMLRRSGSGPRLLPQQVHDRARQYTRATVCSVESTFCNI